MNKRAELGAMLASVDRLAKSMKIKLRRKAREGRSGGLDPENREHVAHLLREHVERLTGGCVHCGRMTDDADPEQAVDVCNLAMMLWAMPRG